MLGKSTHLQVILLQAPQTQQTFLYYTCVNFSSSNNFANLGFFVKVSGVGPFVSCTLKWLELSCFLLTIYNWPGLLATHINVLLTGKRSYPSSLYVCSRGLKVSCLHIMHTNVQRVAPFFKYLQLSTVCATVPFFAPSPDEVQKELPHHILRSDIVWLLPLFASCALKCLELSPVHLTVCSDLSQLATSSQVSLSCRGSHPSLLCKLTWCGSLPLYVVHTGVPGVILFLFDSSPWLWHIGCVHNSATFVISNYNYT